MSTRPRAQAQRGSKMVIPRRGSGRPRIAALGIRIANRRRVRAVGHVESSAAGVGLHLGLGLGHGNNISGAEGTIILRKTSLPWAL